MDFLSGYIEQTYRIPKPRTHTAVNLQKMTRLTIVHRSPKTSAPKVKDSFQLANQNLIK